MKQIQLKPTFYAQTEHMREALEKLDIEYTENDLPDATSGTAGL